MRFVALSMISILGLSWAVLSADPADARTFCTAADPWCEGLVCTGTPYGTVCVPGCLHTDCCNDPWPPNQFWCP